MHTGLGGAAGRQLQERAVATAAVFVCLGRCGVGSPENGIVVDHCCGKRIGCRCDVREMTSVVALKLGL